MLIFQIEFARWLLQNGAEVNARMPSTGWTAGHAATKKGNLELLESLLKSGADQHALAQHKEFGKNLRFEDVTKDEPVLQMLQRYA